MKRRNVIIGSFSTFFLRRRKMRRILKSVDRISALPDSILGIILSFLPTIDAVSTTFLSRRWRLLWTLVHNLDFYYVDSRGELDETDHMTFVEFVDGVLARHDAGWLNKFRLVWSHTCISNHAASWINTAISKNVHELFLQPGTQIYGSIFPVPFVMPISVFSCETLRILELDGGVSVPESIVVRLPKLETITLIAIHFQSEEAFEKLIRGCPVLINLCIAMPYDMSDEFYQDDDFTYIISSTSLRRLEVEIQYPISDPFYVNLELEAPSLEYLSIYGFIPIFPENLTLSSLVEAKLNTDHLDEYNFSDVHMCNSVVKAVRVFEWAKALTLSAHTMWALNCAQMCLSTEFKRLVKLKATTYSCGCSSLRDFIECSHNLEVLSVHQCGSFSRRIVFDNSKWIAPVQVPRCLSSSLKKVKIKGYYGKEVEREMIRYVLNHGKALEDMDIIFSVHCNTKSEFVQEICELSKKLTGKVPVCEVKFAEETSKCNIKVLNHHYHHKIEFLQESLEQ